jgi:hypothetical protein
MLYKECSQGHGAARCPGHEAGIEGGDYPPVCPRLDWHLEAMAAPTGSSASMTCKVQG